MGSILRRATFSPTAALLQLHVVSLLATFLVFHDCGAMTNIAMLATCRCAGLCWCFEGMDCFVVVSKTQPSSIIVPGFICESVVACWHNQAREPPATSRCGCLASRFGQLDLHVENGLLEIFPAVCGSSTPAPSCQDERRQQTSCAAAAGRVAWRVRAQISTDFGRIRRLSTPFNQKKSPPKKERKSFEASKISSGPTYLPPDACTS